MNLLESFKRWESVVAETSDFEAFTEFKPQDPTTNPSLSSQHPVKRTAYGGNDERRPADR
jgi:transaldolase